MKEPDKLKQPSESHGVFADHPFGTAAQPGRAWKA